MDHKVFYYAGPRVFREFNSLQEARAYRHEHGTGGWIFVDQAAGGLATIFPPDMPPSAIFRHPIARGRTGDLIGCG